MKLIHYSDKEFDLECREYNQDSWHWNAKPNGLWVSVEGKYDWKSWCENEAFRLEGLIVSYEVKLKKEARIMHLKSASHVVKLAKLYPWIKPQWDNPESRMLCASYEIDWKRVKEIYQGIIISPYQWTCRLNPECNWYYGWDCASGCLWDLTCIKEFKLRKSNEKNRILAESR